MIDLDLLDFNGQQIDDDQLQIPHPRASDRPFVMNPVHDIEELAGIKSGFQRTAECDQISDETWIDQESETLPLWNSVFDKTNHHFILESLEDTHSVASKISGILTKGNTLILDGDLGAGKTTLTSMICKNLGFRGNVSSPSYALCQEYDTPVGLVNHWDFYRLNEYSDLESTGFFDTNPETVITVIEWGSLFDDELPEDAIRIRLGRFEDSETRELKIRISDSFDALLFRKKISGYAPRHEYSRA